MGGRVCTPSECVCEIWSSMPVTFESVPTPNAIDWWHKSHNATVLYPTMQHFLTEMCTCVHISVTKWCILGHLSDALWDMWDESIQHQHMAHNILIYTAHAPYIPGVLHTICAWLCLVVVCYVSVYIFWDNCTGTGLSIWVIVPWTPYKTYGRKKTKYSIFSVIYRRTYLFWFHQLTVSEMY